MKSVISKDEVMEFADENGFDRNEIIILLRGNSPKQVYDMLCQRKQRRVQNILNSLREMATGETNEEFQATNKNKKKVDPRKKLFTDEDKRKAHLKAQKNYLMRKKLFKNENK